jgi:hypothetical protein
MDIIQESCLDIPSFRVLFPAYRVCARTLVMNILYINLMIPQTNGKVEHEYHGICHYGSAFKSISHHLSGLKWHSKAHRDRHSESLTNAQ